MRYLACAVCLALLCSSGVALAQEEPAASPEEAPSPEEGVSEAAIAEASAASGLDAETVEAVVAQAAEAAADATLNSLIAHASDAQAFHEEGSGDVMSSIVTEAMPAALANGDGDISTTGTLSLLPPPLQMPWRCLRAAKRPLSRPGLSVANRGMADARSGPSDGCAGDIDRFCGGVKPGEGRLHACLRAQLQAQLMGNTEGEQRSMAGDFEPCISSTLPGPEPLPAELSSGLASQWGPSYRSATWRLPTSP